MEYISKLSTLILKPETTNRKAGGSRHGVLGWNGAWGPDDPHPQQ